MLKLKEQVVSLEIAKELKELGVPQKSLFYYWFPVGMVVNSDNIPWQDEVVEKWIGIDESNPIIALKENQPCEYLPFYSAFTVAELGEMLPQGFFSGKINRDGFDCRQEDKRKWFCSEINNGHEEWTRMFKQKISQYEYTEANARGKMLIYLIKQGLISYDK